MIGLASTSAPAQVPLVKELGPDVVPIGKGAPVLMNIWATWCGPCNYEFPELVAIDAEYGPQGLVSVVVSFDNPSLAETRVPEFLSQYEAKMKAVVIDSWDRGEKGRLIRKIAPLYRGGIPFTVVFDAGGKIVFQKTGVFDPEELKAAIEKTITKKPA